MLYILKMAKNKVLLASGIFPEEMQLVDKACRIQGRKRANFVKIVVLEKAKEVVREDKNGRH